MNNPETIATYRTQKTQDEDKQNIKVEKPEGTFRNRNNAETTNKKPPKKTKQKKQKNKTKQNKTQHRKLYRITQTPQKTVVNPVLSKGKQLLQHRCVTQYSQVR